MQLRQRRRAAVAKFTVNFIRRRPEGAGAGCDHRTQTVDRHQRADGSAVGGHDRRRTEAAFQLAHAGHGAVAGPDGAQRKVQAGLADRLDAQLAIRRRELPVFVAAVGQIVQAGGGHDRGDRHAGCWAQCVAFTLLPQPGCDAIRRRQTVNRTAAERQRIDGLYQIVLTERVGFPGGGAAAAHVHGGNRRAVRQDHRRAGAHSAVLRHADLQAGHIGNQVAGAWTPGGGSWHSGT